MHKEADSREGSGSESSSSSSSTGYTDEKIGQCRICHGESELEDLLSPCLCKRTAAYVNQACLDEWINHSKTKKCEMCLGKYESLSTGYKRFNQWTFPRPASNRWEDIANFLCPILWTYMLVQGVFFRTNSGTRAFNDFLLESLESTRLIIFWWLSFLINCTYYLVTVAKICQRWIDENSIYEWNASIRI